MIPPKYRSCSARYRDYPPLGMTEEEILDTATAYAAQHGSVSARDVYYTFAGMAALRAHPHLYGIQQVLREHGWTRTDDRRKSVRFMPPTPTTPQESEPAAANEVAA